MQGKEAPRAFLQGLAGATTRVGLILSSSISAFSMAAIGYVPGMEFTPELIQKMVILIAVIPAVVCAIAGACMISTDWTKSRLRSIMQRSTAPFNKA